MLLYGTADITFNHRGTAVEAIVINGMQYKFRCRWLWNYKYHNINCSTADLNLGRLLFSGERTERGH